MYAKRKREEADARGKKQSKLSFGTSSHPKTVTTTGDRIQCAPTQDQPLQESRTVQDPPAASDTNNDGAEDQGFTKDDSNDGPNKGQETDSLGVTTIRVVDRIGDIFDAPPNAVIIHACNCIGHWGAGIAAAFKQKYPQAYKKHGQHCKGRTPDQLVGTAQLIPPCEVPGKNGEEPLKHYVGCLFTSKRFGKSRDKPAQILEATGPAMEDLLNQIKEAIGDGQEVSEIRTCQINAGLFAVPWKKSKEVMESIVVDGLDEEQRTIIAYARE